MLGVGPTQTSSRFGSSSHLVIKSSEPVDVYLSDGALGPVITSPSGKKWSSLFKGLMRLGSLFSGTSSINAGASEVRPDSDPSVQNGLAHALSSPDLPCTRHISISASPSPLYMDMAQNLASALRLEGPRSPPLETHSPCSPFPLTGRGVFKREKGQSGRPDSGRPGSYSSCDSPSLRCVISCGTPSVLLSSAPSINLDRLKPDQQSSQPQLPAPNLIAVLSTYKSSGSSGSGRLEKVRHEAASVAACDSAETAAAPAAVLSSSLSCGAAALPSPPVVVPAAAAASAAHPVVSVSPTPQRCVLPPQPCVPPPAQPQPNSTLLALHPAVPGPMRRRVWCLDDFQVARRLYKGSSASVYKAVCLRSGLAVALKVYYLTRVPRNVVHMIKREIELHHALVHPHVIQLYAAFLEGDRIVLVQEYAARGDLLHLLRQMGGRMTEVQVSELVMRPFLEALAYLHSQGVCHRDIKPENILYDEHWSLKVADFGVSINLNAERAVTRAGTLDYMAPEVTRCPLKTQPQDNKNNLDLAYTSAVDIWAAGVLSYELLVGFVPVVAPPADAARQQRGVGGGGSSSLSRSLGSARTLHFPSSLSLACRDFIRSALSECPGDRPTAKELQHHPWICA